MILRAMRYSGALAILAVGAIHLQQYIGADYRAVPTIGTLFLLNAIVSAVVGVGLLTPLKRAAKSHRADALVALLALAAIGIAVGSLVALFISESTSLFGFTESGYRLPIIVAIVAEGATIMLLGPVAAVNVAAVTRRSRPPRGRPVGHPGSGLDYGARR